MEKLSIIILIVIVLLIPMIMVNQNSTAIYTNHEPIIISSNNDFLNQGWPGSGTELDPWLLEGLSITGNNSGCIYLKDTTDYVKIQGCYLHDAEGFSVGAGIHLKNVKNVYIVNNELSENTHGILVEGSSLVTIASNNMTSNLQAGIYCNGAKDIICENNIINFSTYDGIHLTESNNISFKNNSMLGCGITIDGPTINWNSHLIDTSNKVNGLPVYYYKDMDNICISEHAGQIILANITNSIIWNMSLVDAEIGILLGHSSSNRIINNNMSGNYSRGISFYYSDNNLIENNTFYGNSDSYGIFDFYSKNNSIVNNSIYHQEFGIAFIFSTNNIVHTNRIENNSIAISIINGDMNYIYNNWFINNSVQGSVSGNNYWNFGQIGNHWDDYTGIDENGDGIGDTPYLIVPLNSNLDTYSDDYPIVPPYYGVNDEISGFTFPIIFLALVISIILKKTLL